MSVGLQSWMAADSTYERQMLGSRMMLDLGQLQDNFQMLLSQAHPDHISAFFYWLDLKVAQFKVFGSCLAQGRIVRFVAFLNIHHVTYHLLFKKGWCKMQPLSA